MHEALPYRTLAPWLEARFGGPVHRVALDAGSSCPNRDGTKGFGGCTYCDVEGSGTGALKSGLELARQLDEGLARVARRGPGVRAIAYLQSYSNTYVPLERLSEVLGVLEPWIERPDAPLAALSIATRPDTLPDESLRLLEELGRRIEVWVELGLESASDEVQRRIRRFHTLADFHDAARRVRQAGLVCIAHAILGLPGDGREGARATALELARAGVEGVKVHQLMVLKRTQLARDWRAGALELLDEPTYVEWLADFVERLAPEQVLHRLTGDADADALLAPLPAFDKSRVRAALARELDRRGTRQSSAR
ncbi:MAG: TIGR01212 family radical SAM protein [Planctomycetes bacterium]|nr:TIGR01212 family radical SAM protein [Planctomycetota bacterium]